MPGNEGGDRVHNFFQQGNFSQEHQPHTLDENWSGFRSNLWQGNERRTAGLVNSKNYNNAQNPGGEGGQGDQLAFGRYGLNFAPPNPRPDFTKSQLQSQQLILNGSGGSCQVPHTVQSEANGMEMDAETERHHYMRAAPVSESQQRCGPHNNLVLDRFGSKESPSNFDILGSQHQMSSQYPGTLHSLARQQSGMSDSQLIQQQVMLKQMQELQRQQQMQQLEAMQRNSTVPVHPFSNQGGGNHAPTFINGTPMHDPSSYPWISQVMNGNRNWVQQRASPSGQVFSTGLIMSPEQGNRTFRFMGVLPQQSSQSLYGVPVSSALSGGVASQVGKAMHQMPMQGNLSYPPNENPSFSKQRNQQEGNTLPGRGFEGNVTFGHASRQDSGEGSYLYGFNQVQPQLPPNMDRRHDVAASPASSFPDSTVRLGDFSQETVALDPTEEKILFGNDDNIWEAFGESLTGGTGGLNQSEGGFPSTQSGSWSALMQSAVAETSSSDEGKQGEWSGVGLRNSGNLAGKQQLPGSRKQPPSWDDGSQMASLAPRPFTSDSYLNSSYHKLQQPFLRQSKDTQPTRSGQQSSQETRKCLDRSPLNMVPHRSMGNELTYHPGDYSSNSSSSRRSHQETIGSPGDQRSRPGNNIQSETRNGVNAYENQANLECNDSERGMNMNLGIGGGMTMPGSLPNSGLDIGRHHINSKGLLSNISLNRTSENAHHMFLRAGNSAMRPQTDDSVTYQPHRDRVRPEVLESPVKNYDQGSAEMHELKNDYHRENSSDSHGSNLSNHASAGGLRENVWLDANGRHGLPGSKQNSIGQANLITTPAPRRFQYPMGEVDTDMNQTKNMLPSNALPHNFYGMLESQESRSRFVNAMASNSAETEKEHPMDIRPSCGASSSGTIPSFTPTASAPVDRSGGAPAPYNSGTSSQIMLELLQKVDQSKEQHTLSHFDSSDLIISSNASEVADAASGSKQSSSSTSSQGFSLQLAPPSQGLRAQRLMTISQNPSQTDSPDPSYVDKGDKVHGWLPSVASSQPIPSAYQSSQRDSNFFGFARTGQINANTSRHNAQTNSLVNHAYESGDKSCLLQNQLITDSFTNSPQNVTASLGELGQTSRSDQSGAKVSGQETIKIDSAAPLQLSTMRGMYYKGELSSMIPNLWTNMMNQQQLLGGQLVNSKNMLKIPFHPNGIPGTSSTNFHQNQFEKDVQKKGEIPPGFVDAEGKMLPVKQLDPAQRSTDDLEANDANSTGVSRPDSGITQKGIETFVHSLSSGVSDNYPLGHRVQSKKEIDPNSRQVKRFKGAEHGSDYQHNHESLHAGSGKENENLSTNCASGDATVLSFASEPSDEREKHIQAQVTLQKGLHVSGGLQESSDNNMNSQISLQMAPTWFKQYGTLKKGQLLHDAHRAQTATNMGQRLFPGQDPMDTGSDCLVLRQPYVVDSDLMANAWSTPDSYISGKKLSPFHPLASGYATGNVDSLRSKKRKSAAADLLPWHKEVASVSQRRLADISMAEHEWSRATHRLSEKIEDEVNASEDSTPVSRARRRLVLTSQLMQQIFQPLPQAILSLDASTECESIMFFVARLVLGDACSLISESDGNSSANLKGGNQSGMLESRSRISYQYLTKVTEDFITSASVLENKFLRLDRRASFLDLRLESQELERFSVINRFAMFHGRNQAEGAEASTESDQATVIQGVGPLRYVNAYSKPKNLPERAQCFTL